jgi:hypothetical protein
MSTIDYIPFVNTAHDCEIAVQTYSDAVAFRLALESSHRTCTSLPVGPKRWLDAGIDGLHEPDTSKYNSGYTTHISRLQGYQDLASPQFQTAPQNNVVQAFVNSALDLCTQYAPDWLSVPQLPLQTDSSRNRINKALADATKAWKLKAGFVGKLIVPAIFTHQNQINSKTERNKKLKQVMAVFQAAGADGVWMVDSTLNDQDASGTFDKRFPRLVNLHEELNELLPDDAITIGGPYWGMNIVLWARGIVRYAGIGLGSSYRYNIPGPILPPGKTRIALAPLRRWSVVDPKLRQWLADTAEKLSKAHDPNVAEFNNLEKDFAHFASKPKARRQTANFYKQWFQKFSSLPPSGRALALYHDLSAAYVLGKGLDDLPDEGPARQPERVQQQLMMNCL